MTDELPPLIVERVRHALPPGLLHDLRTPLGHVIGYAELLKEQVEDAGCPDLLPYIQKINTAALQLLKLMEANFQSSGKPRA